jgi:hypothetical protein
MIEITNAMMGHNTLPLTTVVQQITIRKYKVIITGVETSPCKLLAATRHLCISLWKRARSRPVQTWWPRLATLSTAVKKKKAHQGAPSGSSTLALSQSTELLVVTEAGNAESKSI